MTLEEHWEGVYRTRGPEAVSWFRAHLDTSLQLIRETDIPPSAPIIDVGAGASTLADDLLANGYVDVTALDLSSSALKTTQQRIAGRGAAVSFIVGDITRATLPAGHYALWHDRAVFHFLTQPADRDRYLAQVRHALAPGGFVVIGTFGPAGPRECSGLPTARYDADALQGVFGDCFRLLSHVDERHCTPAGIEQRFVYCLFRLG